MRSMVLPAVALAAGLLTGCTATVTGDAYPPDAYGYQQPDMAYVSPGVQVIADYDEPIFYSDRYYWRLYGGTWYRSPYYTGGWVAAVPPPAVMRIERPRAYVHYRPTGWVGHRGPVVGPPPPVRHYGRPAFEPRRVGPSPAQPRAFPAPPPRVGPPPPPHVGPAPGIRPAPAPGPRRVGPPRR